MQSSTNVFWEMKWTVKILVGFSGFMFIFSMSFGSTKHVQQTIYSPIDIRYVRPWQVQTYNLHI